jgi:hypothetical protein
MHRNKLKFSSAVMLFLRVAVLPIFIRSVFSTPAHYENNHDSTKSGTFYNPAVDVRPKFRYWYVIRLPGMARKEPTSNTLI